MATINYPVGMPYDELSIYDQSVYSDTTDVTSSSLVPDGLIVFQPIISPRGYSKDNDLTFITNSAQLEKYGTPNINKYGLSLYYAKNIIKSGANLLTCRLTADDSMYANNCIYAEFKFDTTSRQPKIANVTYNGSVYKNTLLYEYDIDGETHLIALIYYNSGNKLLTKSYNGANLVVSNYIDLGKKDGIDKINFNEIINTSYKDGSDNVKNFKNGDGNDVEFTVKFGTDSYDLYDSTSDISIGLDEAKFQNYKETIAKVNVTYKSLNLSYSNSTFKKSTDNSTIDDKFIYAFNNEITKIYDEVDEAVEIITDFDSYNLNSFSNPTLAGTKIIGNDKTYVIPIMIVRSLCSGEFANNFTFKISQDIVMSTYSYNDNDPKIFYEFTSYENGTTLDSPISFTFDDNYVYNSESMFVDDVFETYSNNIKITTMDTFYGFEEIVHDFFGTYCADMTDTVIGSVDLFYGTYCDGKTCTNINVNNNLFRFDEPNGYGNKLSCGDDGAFANVKKWTLDATSNDGDVYTEDPFAEYFRRAYSGEISDLIFDEVRMPFRMIFSPTLDQNVNDAIHSLVNERKTTAAFYTFPTGSTTYPQMQAFKNNHYSFYNTFKEYFISEHGVVYDTYTHKRITMPSNYFNSYKIPNYWLKHKGKSFCGVNFYWDDYINGSIMPRTANRDIWISNHNSGLNTMIEDGKGKASPYEQITAQTPAITSKLSELNNTITLLEACSIALTYANDRHWVELNDDEVSDYKRNLESKLDDALGSCWKSVEIVTSQAAVNGAGRNRLLCKIYVTFKDILKGVSYEFYIL